MATDIIFEENKYVICYNLDIPILHYVPVIAGQHLSTGQPEIEVLNTEDEAIVRISELGFNPDDYIVRYKFLMFSTEDECWDAIDSLDNCLEPGYIEKPLTMKNVSDLSIIGYIILVDETIERCLTQTQINHIMTSSGNQIIID